MVWIAKIEPSVLSFNFIGVLYPDDLQDHHNRDNELLLTVPYPYNGKPVLELICDFYNQLLAISDDDSFPWVEFSEDTIIDAISSELAYLVQVDGYLWDFDRYEDCCLYAYLTW